MKLQCLTICAALAIPAALAQGEPKQQPKHFGSGLPEFLKIYDLNNDGTIDEVERQTMVEARDQIADDLRDDWDNDGDGKINDEEREDAQVHLIDLMKEQLAEHFKEADADGDGFLSPEEFIIQPGGGIDKIDVDGIPMFKEIAKMIFNAIDTDNDGKISLAEFTDLGPADPGPAAGQGEGAEGPDYPADEEDGLGLGFLPGAGEGK